MDLDLNDPVFDDLDDTSVPASGSALTVDGDAPVEMTAVEALKYMDDHWYKKVAGKKARWMDLIGDYAGNERFILDGESLLQQVLGDPLLALARPGDSSFQILHAINSLERFLSEMLKRSAVFDVVFWEDTRHLTLKGGTDFVVSSRSLARALLFSHLTEHASEMDLNVYAFSGLADPAWIAYQQRTKPMFVMLNDGGTLAEDDHDMATRVLVQRNLIFSLLTSGIAVTLLHGAEFRDSKIFSFVFEGRFGLEDRKTFPDALWSAVQLSTTKLEEKWKRQFPRVPLVPLRVSPPGLNDLDLFLTKVLDHLVLHHNERTDLFWELTSLFFLHAMVLQTLPVSERAQPLEAINGDFANKLITTFLPDLYSVITAFVLKFNHFVDIDGRIFITLLRFATSGDQLPTHGLEALVGPEISSRLETVWKSTNAPSPDLSKLLACCPTDEDSESESESESASDEDMTSFALFPFHNEVFDDELAAVHVTVAGQGQVPSSIRLEFSQDIPFSDTKHWHAHHRPILPTKHLGGETAKDVGERARTRQLRRDQRFMSQMQRLAATLTGASGKALQQILIPSTGRKVSEIIDDSSVGGPKRGKKEDKKGHAALQIKGKPNAVSGRDRIRQEHAREKKAKEDSSSQEWWVEQLRQVEKLATHDLKISALRGLLRNPRTDTGWLSVEVQLYSLHLTIQRWIAEPEPDAPAVHDRYTVSIMRAVKELYTHVSLTETTLGVLAGIMVALGFMDHIAPLEDDASHRLQPDRDLAFSFVKLTKSKSHKPVYKFMAIKEDPVIWQLRVFGEYMDRSMDSAPDPRVSFQPDAWQREVLDCLDQPKCSLLVVAPTSAGKTFISFYAMERILRESDDGIIVYVAPTKALVNQVAAEVYARFRKEVDGRTCWAIHTRDYHVHDPQKCQILVTVPEMLGIMLLSPTLARTWTPRIRRIILDEIHTIGQHEGGTVWEQIILLAPCPIIGLSATVGEPERFNAWLESVQRSKGFEHKFIHYPHRYSHLRKFAYFPQLLRKDEPFLGLDGGSPPTEVMRFIHPISTLSFGGTIPPDLSLEALDLLRLHEILKSQSDVDAERLDPTTFFSRNTFIRQKDMLTYETEIKNILARFVEAPDALSPSSPLQRVVRHIQDPVIAQTSKSRLNAPPTLARFKSGLIHLLSDLEATDSLPALLFNFDRNDCLLMAKHILDTLEKAEEAWRAQSPEWSRKVSQWKAWQARQQEKQRLVQKAAARKKKQDDDGPQQSEELSWESYFDPQDPSPQFSFAGMSTYPKDELLVDIAELRRWNLTPEFVLRALRRGVAVHHSGMNKGYRVLVERLFRVGFLRVVIATSTLALGINAPTKASVFCGDSPFLTALTYRQCAGRAGRRGFDLLGRVIFYGIPLDRIYRILLSRLPRLTGTFPLSSTMVLRLFNLLEGSDYAPYTVDAIRSILRLPHISFGSDVGKSQLLHHLRFSIDYLRRAHLLNQVGKPINLFGIAAHLYYTEPGNLAITTLLQSGVIHDICSQPDSIQAERDLVAILCHIFGRRYLPQVYASASNVRDLVQKGPSRVVLPPLHAEARALLIEHQKETLGIFGAYALAFSSQHADKLGRDDRLPLSGISFGPSDKSTCPQTALFAHLSQTAVRPKARSLFVAMSGHGDAFGSVGELVRTVRHGVHLNEHAIPTVENILDPELPLNAYLYDFFVHGQDDALVNMNGIRRGDLWYVLDDFHRVLVSIRGELENLLLRTSRESLRAAELDDDATDVGTAVDSGYQSLDPSGRGEDEEEEAGGDDGDGGEAGPGLAAFPRPRGVPDRDWRVYKIVNSITNEFYVKFKAMWA